MSISGRPHLTRPTAYSPPSPSRPRAPHGLHLPRAEVHLSRAAVTTAFDGAPRRKAATTKRRSAAPSSPVHRPQSPTRLFAEFPCPALPRVTSGSLRPDITKIYRAESRPLTPSPCSSPSQRGAANYVFDRQPMNDFRYTRAGGKSRPRTSHDIIHKAANRKIAIDWLGPKTSGLFAGGYGGVPRNARL